MALISALTVIPTSLAATNAAGSPYQGVANELAVKFLQGDATADADLTGFLDKEEVTGTKFKTAVADAVNAGQKLVADGVPAKSKPFARLLAAGSSRYLIVANELAVKFLKGTATEDTDLAKFVQEEEIAGGKFKATLSDVVETGRQLVADNDKDFAKSKYFSRLLATATEAPEPGKTRSDSSVPVAIGQPVKPATPAFSEPYKTTYVELQRRAEQIEAQLPKYLDHSAKADTESAAADKRAVDNPKEAKLQVGADLLKGKAVAAKTKLTEVILEQAMNLAYQKKIEADFAAGLSKKEDERSEKEKAAKPDADKANQDYEIKFALYQKHISALPEDEPSYAKLAVPDAQQKLKKDSEDALAAVTKKQSAIDDDAKTLATSTDPEERKKAEKALAAAPAVLTSLKAKATTAQNKLSNSQVTLRLLRDKYAKESLAWTDDAIPKTVSPAVVKKADDDLAADLAGQEALQKVIAEQSSDPKRTPHAFTHGGLRMISPYIIEDELDPSDPTKKTGNKIISPGSTKVAAFFEITYTNIWAWRPLRQSESRNGLKTTQSNYTQYVGAGWTNKDASQGIGFLDNSWDMTGRVSFEFGKDSQPTATAITGSGDFNAEFTVDKHLIRGFSDDDHTAFSFSAFAAVGGVTDHNSLKVHPRLEFGPSLALGFDDPFSSGTPPRKVWFRMQGGLALIDSLEFKDSTSRVIVLSQGDLPKYAHKTAYALEAEVFWPINDFSLMTVGARLYGHAQPAPWSLYLGITVPITKTFESLSPK